MTHAYDKDYLRIVQDNLSLVFYIGVNYLNYTSFEFSNLFENSKLAMQIEKGDLTIILGKSAKDWLDEITDCSFDIKENSIEYNQIYWAGWALAQIQWQLNITFSELFKIIPFDYLISLYNPYHEAPIEKLLDEIKQKSADKSSLQRKRKAMGISQKKLSTISNVNLKSIQLYETKKDSILSAKGETLYKLANALSCNIEDLLKD